MAIRFTDLYLTLHVDTGRPLQTQFTNMWAAPLGKNIGRRQTRVTQGYAQMLGTLHSNQGNEWHATTVYAQVLAHWTPTFEWREDMFIYEQFPYDISYNSIGKTRFATDVVVVDSGDDQRNARWNQPLMVYDIAYAVRTMEHLHGLITFFRAMKGKLHGFLYRDPVDHKSNLATRIEARDSDPITMLDQQIGIGDGDRKTFQLIKSYPTLGGQVTVRPIIKPKTPTVMVAKNGVLWDKVVVDGTNGKVTFTTDLVLHGLPALTLTVSGIRAVQIVGSGNCFAALNVGDRVVTFGWVNPVNNTSEAMRVYVTAKPDANTIQLSVPTGVGSFESNRIGVTLYRHPAPNAGDVITAGYEFWVPVRFDTDEIPVTLEEYGIGNAADVRLIEIRPGEAQ